MWLVIRRRQLNFLLHGPNPLLFPAYQNNNNNDFTYKYFLFFTIYISSNMIFFFSTAIKYMKNENLVHLILLNHRVKRCDALRDLVQFVQFKNREKHLWRSVNFSKVAGFSKIITPPWVLFTFFKLSKWHQIAQRTTVVVGFICNFCWYSSTSFFNLMIFYMCQPTDQPKIILLTARTANKFSCLRLSSILWHIL